MRSNNTPAIQPPSAMPTVVANGAALQADSSPDGHHVGAVARRSSCTRRRMPHSGFPRLMRLIRARTSRGIAGRPPPRRRDFHVQYSRKPFRCQPMTVSGFTITSISRQFGMSRDRSTQSRRSVGRSEGRREVLFIVASTGEGADRAEEPRLQHGGLQGNRPAGKRENPENRGVKPGRCPGDHTARQDSRQPRHFSRCP